MNTTDEILHYWFGELQNGMPIKDKMPLWFGARAADDDEMRTRFGGDIARACAGDYESWTESDDGAVALVLLTDQMTRAVYRGSADAFGGDPVALATCCRGIADGRHLQMPPAHRQFFYMPLMHSESLTNLEQCVDLFRQLAQQHPAYEEIIPHAVDHRDIIAQFGRYPHRNGIIGRASTPEEEKYLHDNPKNFGQK